MYDVLSAGMGKTSLVARLLKYLPPARLPFSMVSDPGTPTFSARFLVNSQRDFSKFWLDANSLEPTAAPADAAEADRRGQREGNATLLVVDQAHRLSAETIADSETRAAYGNANATT